MVPPLRRSEKETYEVWVECLREETGDRVCILDVGGGIGSQEPVLPVTTESRPCTLVQDGLYSRPGAGRVSLWAADESRHPLGSEVRRGEKGTDSRGGPRVSDPPRDDQGRSPFGHTILT